MANQYRTLTRDIASSLRSQNVDAAAAGVALDAFARALPDDKLRASLGEPGSEQRAAVVEAVEAHLAEDDGDDDLGADDDTLSALASVAAEAAFAKDAVALGKCCRDAAQTLGEAEIPLLDRSDGDGVACGSQDNSVHFWRRSTGQDSMMSGYPAKPSTLSFDDTGTLLATGGGDTVIVWSFEGDGPEGTEPGLLEVPDHLITALAWACRGRCLASGGRDSIVALWTLGRDGQGDPSGGALRNDMVSDLYWRPDGRALAALDAQGGVTAWRVGSR